MPGHNLTLEHFVSRGAGRVSTLQRMLITLLATVMAAALGGVGLAQAMGNAGGVSPAVECDPDGVEPWTGDDFYLNKFDDMDDDGSPSGHWDVGGTTETGDGVFHSDDGFSISWNGTTLHWTSTQQVAFIVVKGGNTDNNGKGALGYVLYVEVADGVFAGTIDVASGLGSGDQKLAGLSHVTFCDGEDPPPSTYGYSQGFSDECDTATLVLTNHANSDGAIDLTYTVDDGTATTVSVAVGTTETVHFAIPADGSIQIDSSVDVNGDGTPEATYSDQGFWEDCSDTFDVSFTESYSCGNSGSFTMTNASTSDGSVTFSWTAGTDTGDATLAPGASQKIPVTVPTDGSVNYGATTTPQANGAPFSSSQDHVACPVIRQTDPPEPPEVDDVVLVNNPDASVSFSCDDGGFVFLDNRDSDGEVTFVVTIDGNATEFDVGAGSVRNLPFDIEEDTTSSVTVTADGATLVDDSFTADCAEVLGIVIETPPPAPEPEPEPEPAPEVLPIEIENEPDVLPATGASTTTLAILGGMTALAGATLLLGDRRRKPIGSRT